MHQILRNATQGHESSLIEARLWPMQLRIEGARIWDGEAEFTSKIPVSIGISGSEIVSMEAGLTSQAEEVIECPPGSVMIPGLIDAHVHLDLDPTIMKPDDQFTPSREDRDLRMIARAQAMVQAGITTARDLGAGEWRELLLRDAIERQEIEGPRLLCVGQPLTITDVFSSAEKDLSWWHHAVAYFEVARRR